MAWETRARGGSYYCRSVRVNGRVTRQYVGSGELARLIAEADALGREIREDERRQARAGREADAELEAAVAAYCRQVEAALLGAMAAAGYHRPQRGRWRRIRGTKDDGHGGCGEDAPGDRDDAR